MLTIEEGTPDPDFDKSPDYIERRNQLLERMKKQRWEDSAPESQSKRGRKPKEQPKPMVDKDKPRNKFFKFD